MPESDRFRISSADPGRWLELNHAEPEGGPGPVDRVLVTLRLHGLEASARVDLNTDATQDGEQLAKLFAQMANEWRGWKGEKIWRSLDGELNLAFRHDGIGAIGVKVRMRDETMVNWVVEGGTGT
jgi:hypothetical protein